MHVVTTTRAMMRAVDTVYPTIRRNQSSSVPFFSCIQIAATSEAVRVTATGRDTTRSTIEGVTVTEPEATAVPGTLLRKVLHTFHKDAALTLSTSKPGQLTLAAGYASVTIDCLSTEEYPDVPWHAPEGQTFAVLEKGSRLHAALTGVVYAAANENENTRPTLTGVFVKSAAGMVSLAAADGFMLAFDHFSEPGAPEGEWIIPKDAAACMLRLLKNGGKLAFASDQVHAITKDAIYSAKLIDGKFPDYMAVIPQGNAPIKASVECADLRGQLQAAAMFATSNMVKFSVQDGELRLSSEANTIGAYGATLPAKTEGKGFIILDAYRVLRSLQVITTRRVSIQLHGSTIPAMLYPVGQEGPTHIIMPMTPRAYMGSDENEDAQQPSAEQGQDNAGA